MGGRFFRIGSNGSLIFTSVARGVSAMTGAGTAGSTGASASASARVSFVIHGSAFGFASSSSIRGAGAILNGIRSGVGAADTGGGREGKFGTDGPLEAGTLSDAGAP